MVLVVLFACSSGSVETPACPAPAHVAACYSGPVEPDPDGAEGAVAGDWEGEVIEAVEGAFPETCASGVGDAADGSGWALRVDTPEGEVWAGIEAPGATLPSVDDTVRVRVTANDSVPELGSVEVSMGGVIVGWVGAAAQPADLSPLGVDLDYGEPSCTRSLGCGDARGYGLEVSVGAAQGLGVPYGTTGTIGTFQVTNADLSAAVGDAPCTEGASARARVGIGR